MPDVKLDFLSPQLALITINRASARNAIDQNVRQLLAEHFDVLGRTPEIRCIILTGGDKYFAAGADIRNMADATSTEMLLRHSHLLWQAIAACPKPVIAAVNGYAWGGGCELAMHADIIIAGENASFSQPEVRVGIMPGAGGTQRLTRAVGKFKAMKMLLSGQPISAQEAYVAGLASEVVADDQVLARAIELAEHLCTLPPLALMQIKEAVLAGQDASLAAGLLLERKAFQLLFSSQDQKEGMNAFLEKRQPTFQGH